MTAARVEHKRRASQLAELTNKFGFMLLAAPTDEANHASRSMHTEAAAQAVDPDVLRTDIEAMRATVKAGVQVLAAPQPLRHRSTWPRAWSILLAWVS